MVELDHFYGGGHAETIPHMGVAQTLMAHGRGTDTHVSHGGGTWGWHRHSCLMNVCFYCMAKRCRPNSHFGFCLGAIDVKRKYILCRF